MSFKFRRGLESERITIIPDLAEPIYTTDEKRFYIGDGTTSGGTYIGGSFSVPDIIDVDVSSVIDGQVLIYTGGTWVASTNPVGITDHGVLTGLLDNDHPQYRLTADTIDLQIDVTNTAHTHDQYYEENDDTIFNSITAVTYSGVWHSAGFIEMGDYEIDHTGLTITIEDQEAILYSDGEDITILTSGWTSSPKRYTIPGASFSIPTGITSYVVADYSGGSPSFDLLTNGELDKINESNVIPYLTLAVETQLPGYHVLTTCWDHLAYGLPNKMHSRAVKTRRFALESGLNLNIDASNQVTISESALWMGANRIVSPSSDSTTTNWTFLYHSGGEWVKTTATTTFNDTQYDDGTDLQTLLPQKWVVNWVYKNVSCLDNRAYYLLSNTYGSLSEAQASGEITDKPQYLDTHCVLVSRIITKQDDGINAIVESAFDTTFAGSAGITSHNYLNGLQGGDVGEYYHLTSTEHTSLTTSVNADSLHLHAYSALTNIPVLEKSIVILEPRADENIGLGYYTSAITISNTYSVLRGTTPSLSYEFYTGTSRDSGTQIFSGTVSSTTTPTQENVNSVVPTNSFLWLQTSETGGTIDNFEITLNYIKD